MTLEVRRHEVVGLIGPNGAGKTTLVNIITGFDSPDAGSVELDGRDVTRWRPHRRARAGLARTFQQSRLFTGLSVRENVEVSALASGARTAEARSRAADLLATVGLGESEYRPAGVLPHGEQRKLGVARALATRPRFVLMDEPAAGLQESDIPDFVEAIRAVRDEGEAGVLLIDHNVALIMAVCDRIHVLDRGRTIAEGEPGEIRRSAVVAAAYLGG